MGVNFTDLHCKEVICVSDGRRLGYISDARIDLPQGHILAIIVPAPGKIFGLLGRRDEYIIPWHCICKMGPDIILVDVKPEECRAPRPKLKFLL